MVDDQLLWYPTDECLHNDPAFKSTFTKYAESQAAFFEDYAKAHKKLSEVGENTNTQNTIRHKQLSSNNKTTTM